MIHCTFENGNKASLRHVTVGIIALNDKGQVLLVKRAPHLWNGDKYTIPGGFLDRDEDAKTGALRELSEETGLTGYNPQLFRINDSPRRPKEDRQNVDIIYIASGISGDVKENKEVATIEWFNQDSLPAEEEFAFDHRDSILSYFAYRRQAFQLPIIG